MPSRPDVLVLGGGGVLGEAWMMGVLAGIEDGASLDLRACEAFVGTSAGGVGAAHLLRRQGPAAPVECWNRGRARIHRTRPRPGGGRRGRRAARRSDRAGGERDVC